MLNVDLPATRERIKDRCVAPSRVAEKYGINKTSMSMFLRGQFFGTSGQGEYGRCEQALIDMGLLVFTVQREEKPRKAA